LRRCDSVWSLPAKVSWPSQASLLREPRELPGIPLRREPLEVRKATLASVLRKARPGVELNEHLEHEDGEVVFRHACKMGLEGIVSKRLGSRYRSGRSHDWLKFKNPAAPAVKREAEEEWGR
jgi:bifunctional non-homologous end joining protein LigD